MVNYNCLSITHKIEMYGFDVWPTLAWFYIHICVWNMCLLVSLNPAPHYHLICSIGLVRKLLHTTFMVFFLFPKMPSSLSLPSIHMNEALETSYQLKLILPHQKTTTTTALLLTNRSPLLTIISAYPIHVVEPVSAKSIGTVNTCMHTYICIAHTYYSVDILTMSTLNQ